MKTLITGSYSAFVKNSFKAIYSLRDMCDPASQGSPYYMDSANSHRSTFKFSLPSFSAKKRLSYTWR